MQVFSCDPARLGHQEFGSQAEVRPRGVIIAMGGAAATELVRNQNRRPAKGFRDGG